MNEEIIRITEVRCLNCGAPAAFDIVRQEYVCGYCGGTVGIKDAQTQVKGFRKIQGDRLKKTVASFKLGMASCTVCGASIVFAENEALTACPFCTQSLIRKDYLHSDDFPENVIPFSLTLSEAQERLQEWCRDNSAKPEARHLKKLTGELEGCYLPYEMIRGPVDMEVSRMDTGRTYNCSGFISDAFVNRSKQLDNLLLDGMEPYDIEALTEFEFGYIAGHRVKIMDVPEDELAKRINEEAEAACKPAVRKVLETKAVDIDVFLHSAIRIPVLLPVYFISHGNIMAAVNGQTGKVSVRAEKNSRYYFLPWWLKAILATAVICLAVFAGTYLLGMTLRESISLSGLLSIVILIITLCLYSDTARNSFTVESGREIFTSGGKTFHREPGGLVQDEKILKQKVLEPVFFKKINGIDTPVKLKFTTPGRLAKMILLALTALFLPVLLALLINGFDFQKLELGGSAVWFCIMVPVVPIYLLKFGIVELYEKPLVYIQKENGKTVRCKEKHPVDRELVKIILRSFFIPPVCFAVWLGVFSFCFIVYLTAFGF